MGLRHWERRLATGVNAVLVAIFVVVAIQLLVDVVDRLGPRWDLTAEGSASLLPETLSAVARLDQAGMDVRITAFTAQRKDDLARTRDRRLADFLRELESASSRIRTELVDFDRDRLTAEQLGVDRYGTVVLEARGDRVDLEDRRLFRHTGPRDARAVEFVGEGAVAAALEQLLAAETRVVYALEGHGERLPFDRGLGDLRGLGDVIGSLGMRHRSLDLLDGAGPPEVPADAAAVLVLGPTAPIPPAEQDALVEYLQRGGGLLLLHESSAPMPAFVERFGVLRPAGTVMDARSLYPWEDRPLLGPRSHPITKALAEDGLAVVVGGAGPVEVVPVDGVRAEPLLGTGRTGWVERGTERPARLDPGIDGEGPVDVAVAVRSGDGRLVVVGDADWVADPLIDEGPGNRTFAGSVLRWLVEAGEPTVRMAPRREVRRVALTRRQLLGVRVFLLGLWPLGVLGLGLVVLARRRW